MERLGSRGKARHWLAAVSFAACCAPRISHAQYSIPHLHLTTEQLAPLNMSDDNGKTLRGVSVERIEEMMHRTGIDYQIELMAWNRAIEIAKRQPDACVFSTARTPDRESWFKWLGPIAKGEWMMYGPAEKLGKIATLNQVRNTRIGGYLGDAAAHYLEDMGYPVVESYSDDATLKNLLAGRLDYWVSSRGAAAAIIAGAHAESRVVPLFHVKTVDYYLACNKQVSDDVMNSLRASLKQMMSDGSFDRAEAKYAPPR